MANPEIKYRAVEAIDLSNIVEIPATDTAPALFMRSFVIRLAYGDLYQIDLYAPRRECLLLPEAPP